MLVPAQSLPARAHAVLVATTPSNGALLTEAPEEVRLEFNEPVEIALGAVRVFDSSARRIDSGKVTHPEGNPNAVAVKLSPSGAGTYLVAWRVVSSDSHPVSGAFTYSVGRAAPDEQGTSSVEVDFAPDAATAGLYRTVRFAAYTSIVMLIGGCFFLAALWPQGRGTARARRILWGSWVAATLLSIGGVPIHGVYASALPLSSVFRIDVLRSAFSTKLAVLWLARGALLLVSAPLILWLFKEKRDPNENGVEDAGRPHSLWAVSASTVALAIAILTALSGHAGATPPVAVSVFVAALHLLGVSVWVGGLVMLVAVAAFRAKDAELAKLAPAFSTTALWSVGVIFLSGVLQSWRQLGGPAGLYTTYGVLLGAKVVLFAAALFAASASRNWVRSLARRAQDGDAGHAGPDSIDEDRAAQPDAANSGAESTATSAGEAQVALRRQGLTRPVFVEVVIVCAVLLVTAFLVDTEPAKSAISKPFTAEVEGSNFTTIVIADPAKRGANTLHFLALTPEGKPKPVENIRARLTLPSKEIGPLVVEPDFAGVGHYISEGYRIPLSGDWQMEVILRLSPIDEERVVLTVPVR